VHVHQQKLGRLYHNEDHIQINKRILAGFKPPGCNFLPSIKDGPLAHFQPKRGWLCLEGTCSPFQLIILLRTAANNAIQPIAHTQQIYIFSILPPNMPFYLARTLLNTWRCSHPRTVSLIRNTCASPSNELLSHWWVSAVPIPQQFFSYYHAWAQCVPSSTSG
jgi:hypothetical protein